VARRLRGEDARADHTAVPRVTFTDPEVASVGLSEAAARELRRLGATFTTSTAGRSSWLPIGRPACCWGRPWSRLERARSWVSWCWR
jgi:pyruvate/2-oxoglutarate dehydrogenase complex dihydrolipoamide dehydrogenase (E3) component